MDFTNDPFALAGLGVLGGKDLSTAMTEAAASIRQRQLDQQEMAYRQAQIGKLAMDARMNQQMMLARSQALGGGMPQPQIPSIDTSQGFLSRPAEFAGNTTDSQGVISYNQQPIGQAAQQPQQMEAPQMGAIDPDKLLRYGLEFGDDTAVAAANALFSRSQGLDNERFTRQGKVADDYAKATEPHRVAVQDFNSAVELAKQNSGAADYQLIKMGVQAYDKRASAVTDDEFENMRKTGSLAQKFGSAYKGYSTGETLTQEQRRQLLNAIQVRANEAKNSLGKLDDSYRKRSQTYGVDFDEIKQGYDVDTSSIGTPQSQSQPTRISRDEAIAEAKRRGLKINGR